MLSQASSSALSSLEAKVKAFSDAGSTLARRVRETTAEQATQGTLSAISGVSQVISPDLSITNKTVTSLIRRACERYKEPGHTDCSVYVTSRGAMGRVGVQVLSTMFNVVCAVYTCLWMSWEVAMFIMPSGWRKMYEILCAKSPLAIALAFVAFHYTDFTHAYTHRLQRTLDEIGLDRVDLLVERMSAWKPSRVQMARWAEKGRQVMPAWVNVADMQRWLAVFYDQIAKNSRQIMRKVAIALGDKLTTHATKDAAPLVPDAARDVLTPDAVSEVVVLELVAASESSLPDSLSQSDDAVAAVSLDDFATVQFGDRDNMTYVEYLVDMEVRLDKWAHDLQNVVRTERRQKKHFSQGDRRRVVREVQDKLGGHDSHGRALCVKDNQCRRRARAIPFNSKTGRKRVWCESECEASWLDTDQEPWCYVSGAHFADNPGAYRKTAITGRPWMYCDKNKTSPKKTCDIGLEYGNCDTEDL